MDSKLDQRLKYPLNLDLLRIGRIIECDATAANPCPGIDLMDEYFANSITTARRKAVESGEVRPWDAPVFADFVMVRDFVEEQALKTGFYLVYPKLGVPNEYQPCFDRMCYEDRVFNAWAGMTERQRRLAVDRHWRTYESQMAALEDELVDWEDGLPD
jgi:tubulin polyglutamylase TTLL4